MSVNLAGGGITAARCHRCNQYWCFNSGPTGNFQAITKFCPVCIPYMLPLMGVATLPRRSA